MKKNNIAHIGIIGESIGSSLLCLEAKKRGIKTTLLDNTIDSVSARFADEHLIAEANLGNIQKLALRVDAIIFGKNIYTNFKEQPLKNAITYPSIEIMNLLKSKMGWLKLAEENEVPIPLYYYQRNTKEPFEEPEDLPFPFEFYQYYPSRMDVIEVTTTKELENFIFEIDEQADGWLSIAKEEYEDILSITGIIDSNNKIYIHELSNEVSGDDEIIMYSPAKVSKTIYTKVTRYTKKMLKSIGSTGVYTFIYGMKDKKKIELVDVTLEMDEHQVPTMHYYNLSVYEQFLNMVTEQKVVQPKLMTPSITHKIFAEDLSKMIKTLQTPCHIYELVPGEKVVTTIETEE